MTEQEEAYRNRAKESYIENAELYNEIRQQGLELLKRQYELTSDLNTTICTLSFAVGAAVVPIINQFSGNHRINHPALLLLAAGILVFNGTFILLNKKRAIDNESLTVNLFGLPQLISISKTRSVQEAYITGQADSKELDKRLKEQVADAETIIGRPKAKERRISLAMDFYLGLMLIGFAFIGASIVSGHNAFVNYWHIVAVIGITYIAFGIDSLIKVIKNNREKDKLITQLEEAEKYRIPKD
jgi:hypothetical protein